MGFADEVAYGRGDQPNGEPSGGGSSQLFAAFEQWVELWLAPTIRRRRAHWCAQWWRHPEAVERLRALWDAWELATAAGGAAMSHWWYMDFDHHWAALSGDDGTFSACDNGHKASLRPLRCDPPPADWDWSDPSPDAGDAGEGAPS